MKNSNYLFHLFLGICLVHIVSCKTKKPVQMSRNQVVKIKKDTSVAVNSAKNTKKPFSTKKQIHPNNKLSTSIDSIYVYSPFIPTEVTKSFNISYPLVNQVDWTKLMPLIKMENENQRNYKASFLLYKNKNSVIYSENGQLIETRVEILPEQLPPNIYEAIRDKYPDASILSATTFKNTQINGSYTAIIREKSHKEVIELILTETGTFVK